MIRPELRNFYDTDENINQSLITLNAFTEKFSNNTYILQTQIEAKTKLLEAIDNSFIPFKLSLDQMNNKIRLCSAEMTQRAPLISRFLHAFEYLQKELTHIKNKNIILQSSETYERDIMNINTKINTSLQNYTTEIKLYNDRIDVLQEMITYLNRTDNSSQSSTSNQFILSWNSILNNFDNLIKVIQNDTEAVNNMKDLLDTFVSSIQNVKLIKLRELKNIESQMEQSSILVEDLQKQVSDLSAKNLELTNTVSTFREERDKIHLLDLQNADLRNRNEQLAEQVADLKTENKELRKNRDACVKQHNDCKINMEQERLKLEAKIQELENENETAIFNLNSEHKKKLTNLTKKEEKLNNEINQLQKLHVDDNDANTNLQEQNNKQRETINSLYRQLDELKQQSENDLAEREQNLLHRVQELENQLSRTELKQKQDQAKIENLKVVEENLTQTNKMQHKKITSMTEELVHKDLHTSKLENDWKTLEQNWNQREVELEQKCKARESENQSLKNQIEELTQAGPSTEILSTKVSDDSQSKTNQKRKLRSDENLTKRPKLPNYSFWQKQIKKLQFTDSHVTSTIDSINEMKWNPLRTKIKESEEKLNRLHEKLAVVFKRFETKQKLRNKNENENAPREINDIKSEIYEHLKIEEQYKDLLTDILLQTDNNYEKDIDLIRNSNVIFINLINSIRTDYDENVKSYKQKLSPLAANQKTAKTSSDLKNISENLEKINNKLKKNRDITNTKLKDLQNEIIQFIERFNKRNEKRKKLLFSVKCHIVSNMYSKVKNELLISIDKLIY